MIEIVCPNCEARYQLPDGAIGPEGRKVSCSSCAHKWRAHPEGAAAVAAPAPAPAPVPAPAPRERTAEEAMAALAAAQNSLMEAAATPPPATGNRDEQMAAIRQMLSDLKEAADTVPDHSDGAAARERPAPAPAAPGPSARRRDDDAPNRDRLEDRIDDVDRLAKMVKGEPTGDGYDAAKLRKRHEKRAKRLQKARERRHKSGAFLTGFTLVAVVSSVMVGLYVMHPQIIASSPEMEPALVQYVTTVDRYRIEFAETTQDWREWLTERIGKLTKKGEEQQPKP